MAKWLDKALGRSAPDSRTVVPYAVACSCGTQLSGTRRNRASRVICPQCGDARFILPANPYPECERKFFGDVAKTTAVVDDRDDSDIKASGSGYGLRSPVETIARPEPASYEIEDDNSDDAAGGDILDELLAEDLDAGATSTKGRAPRDKKAARKAPPAPEPAPTSGRGRRLNTPADENRIELPELTADRRETRKRLLIVGSALVVMLFGMVFWALRGHQHNLAEQQLRTASESGLAAFDAGDFGTARRELRQAVEAMRTLGTEPEAGSRLHRCWLAAEAIVGLLNEGLVDVVHIADQTVNASSEEDWKARFDTSFKDRWLVLDLPLRTGGAAANTASFEFYWTVNGRPIFLAGLKSAIDRLNAAAPGSDRVVLAAQLADCTRDGNRWTVTFNEQSTLLWTEFGALVHLGLADRDSPEGLELEQRLKRQATVAPSDPGDGGSLTEAVAKGDADSSAANVEENTDASE